MSIQKKYIPTFFGSSASPKPAFKRMFLGFTLILLCISGVYGTEWPTPPYPQPDQLWSRIKYDSGLTDPFFHSTDWGLRYYDTSIGGGFDCSEHDLDWVRKHSGDIDAEVKYPSVRQTARFFSNSNGDRHLVKFCEARLHSPSVIEIFIHESNPAYVDNLIIRIQNNAYTCQYWTYYKKMLVPKTLVVWITTRQSLFLTKRKYRKGDIIEGRIEFECHEQLTNSIYIKHRENPKNPIRIFGVFKTYIR